MVQVVPTGDVPESFVLFALGFVLVVFGHLLGVSR